MAMLRENVVEKWVLVRKYDVKMQKIDGFS